MTSRVHRLAGLVKFHFSFPIQVAFNLAQFLDGEKTVNKRSGRVHKPYKGRGIFRVLSEELDMYIKNERPNVEFGIFCTSDVVGRGSSKYLEKGYVEIHSKVFYLVYIQR